MLESWRDHHYHHRGHFRCSGSMKARQRCFNIFPSTTNDHSARNSRSQVQRRASRNHKKRPRRSIARFRERRGTSLSYSILWLQMRLHYATSFNSPETQHMPLTSLAKLEPGQRQVPGHWLSPDEPSLIIAENDFKSTIRRQHRSSRSPLTEQTTFDVPGHEVAEAYVAVRWQVVHGEEICLL